MTADKTAFRVQFNLAEKTKPALFRCSSMQRVLKGKQSFLLLVLWIDLFYKQISFDFNTPACSIVL